MTQTFMTALLAMFAVTATPQADGEDTARGHGKHGVCAHVECTDAQKEKIRSIRAETKAKTAGDRAKIKTLRAAFVAEKQSKDPDAAKLAALRTEMRALRAKMKAARHEARAQIKALLTPEQREKLEAHKAERKRERAERGKSKKRKRGERDGSKKGKRGERGASKKAERDAKARGDVTHEPAAFKARGERKRGPDKVKAKSKPTKSAERARHGQRGGRGRANG